MALNALTICGIKRTNSEVVLITSTITMPISGKLADRYERTPLLLVGTALVLFIPISVLRDHSKMREVSHRTETLRVGFQLIESFTHLINHGIKRGKSEIRELFFA